jgi:Rieske Fe-S protein
MSQEIETSRPDGPLPAASEKCDDCAGRATCEKWREDFPSEWAADNYVTRREFTKFLVLTSGATFLGNGYFVLREAMSNRQPGSAASVPVAATDEMKVGDVRLFRYPTEADPAMLIRLDAETFVAYRQRCTHLSCPVNFNADAVRLDCPCHNGSFDAATGRVLWGPPPRPLPKIALRVENGHVYATGLVPQGGESAVTGGENA